VEAVTAVVVIRPGESLDEAALIDFVAASLAAYKKPRRVLFRDALPRTVVGKLDRRSLRRDYKP
jgi:acyl-CoA synthetase (AMP-forming)/AMP-acid ligase II